MENRDAASDVRFGTDGWRGIIARDFTFDNVARVAQGIAAFLHSDARERDPIYTDWGTPCRDAAHGVVVGYDTRFLSEEFALHCAAVLHQNDIPVVLSNGFVSTPAVSYAVFQRQAAMGIMLTSSHNPPEYNGLKIKAEYGGSAPESITTAVEARLPQQTPVVVEPDPALDRVDLATPYMARIAELIDQERLASSPIHVVVDSMYGSAQGLVAEFLKARQVPFTQIRGTVDVMFGGYGPEPLEKNLEPLKRAMLDAQKTSRRTIGVVTDGDGDRISAMDERGQFIDAQRTFALILHYLAAVRGWRGAVVASFNVSDIIRRICDAFNLQLIEIKIGFKHAAEYILTRDVMIAGEESGSIAVRGHIPERDGVLGSLLLAEMLAESDKTASGMVEELHKKYGPQVYHRTDIKLQERIEIVERLKANPPARFGGKPVRAIETLDGFKMRFDDGWLLFRASGTEPKLRMYCELPTEVAVKQMLTEAETFARGDVK